MSARFSPAANRDSGRSRGLNWICSLLLVGLVGCGKSSPTEPETGYWLINDGVIENVSAAATLVTFQGYIDGVPITFSPVTAAPRVSDSATGATLKPSGRQGSHTLEFRVLDQVGSPNVYRVRNLKVFFTTITGQVLGSTALPEATQSLSTGQGIIYQFSI